MGINRMYLLIGAVVAFFLYLIIFGGPDVEKMKQRREAKKTKNLVERTIEAAKKKDGIMSGINKEGKNPNGLKYGMDTSSDIEVTVPDESGAKPQRGITAMRPGSTVTQRKQSPGAAISEGNTTGSPIDAATQQAPTPASDGYYPPPSQRVVPKSRGSKPTSENKYENAPTEQEVVSKELMAMMMPYGTRLNVVSSELNAEDPTERRQRVKRGEAKENKDVFVAFEGTRAYMVDETTGESRPLPDGYYGVPGSTRKILIRGGEKVVPN